MFHFALFMKPFKIIPYITLAATLLTTPLFAQYFNPLPKKAKTETVNLNNGYAFDNREWNVFQSKKRNI